MLVFVDESGDAGLKVGRGSTSHFVVALVIFEDREEAVAVDKRIDLLREELGLHPRFEFKFNRCNKTLRRRFLEAVAPYEFFYHGIAINKSKLWGEGFKYKGPFYKYSSNLVFQNVKAFLDNATVIIDGSGSKDFRKQMGTYLKRRINDPGQHRISKVKTQDSSRNNLLQLADMIAGAIYRGFGQKGDASLYRQIVSHREMYVQLWPR